MSHFVANWLCQTPSILKRTMFHVYWNTIMNIIMHSSGMGLPLPPTVSQSAPLFKDSQSTWYTDMGSYIPYISSPQTTGYTLLQRSWGVEDRWPLDLLYVTPFKSWQPYRVIKQPFEGIANMLAWRWHPGGVEHYSSRYSIYLKPIVSLWCCALVAWILRFRNLVIE